MSNEMPSRVITRDHTWILAAAAAGRPCRRLGPCRRPWHVSISSESADESAESANCATWQVLKVRPVCLRRRPCRGQREQLQPVLPRCSGCSYNYYPEQEHQLLRHTSVRRRQQARTRPCRQREEYFAFGSYYHDFGQQQRAITRLEQAGAVRILERHDVCDRERASCDWRGFGRRAA